MKYLKLFENDSIELLYKKNLKVLKHYIIELEKATPISMMRDYAIVLHNFLILEHYFQKEVKKANCELNIYLNLKEKNNVREIDKLLSDLYDPYAVVRNQVENLTYRVESIADFVEINPDVFKRLYDEKEIMIVAKTYRYNL